MESIFISSRITQAMDVMRIADSIGRNVNETVGILVRWFAWVETEDRRCEGRIKLVTPSMVDDVTGADGVAEALVAVNWVSFDDDGIIIHDSDVHLRGDLRKRSMAARRKRKSRVWGAQ